MHKYFANSLFLGKKTIYLPECHSTNAEALELIRSQGENHGTLVHTDHQTAGRGQKGNVWLSEPQKNLLFSIVLKINFLEAPKSYLLNVMTCLALRDVISRVLGERLVEIKWPNDLYVEKAKISGILVETLLRGSSVDYAIVGVGINVNQNHFSLLTATSIRMVAKKEFSRTAIMDAFLKSMEYYFMMLRGGKEAFLLARYHDNLMWRDELHTFKDEFGKFFQGKITGIDAHGRLIINKLGTEKPYDIKQVSFIE